MTANARAFFLLPPQLAEFGGGVGSALWPEAAPGVIWGQGTPDGDRAPFTILNKGSLYLQTNATDDYSCVYMKVDEGGDDADWVRSLNEVMGIDHGTASGTDSTINWDIAATMAGAVYYSGLDVAVTLAGTAAPWASTAYFAMTQTTTKSVNGYLSVLELELTSGCDSSSAMFPLVINYSDNSTLNVSGQTAWIALREYGTNAPAGVFWLGQEIVDAVGSSSTTAVFTEVAAAYEANCDYVLRIIAGSANTPYWVLLSSTAPS